MKDGAFFDKFLGFAISIYFSDHDRFVELHELVVARLTFDEKIRVLEKLKYKKVYKSVAALPVIREVQQVRNLLAHEYYIGDDHRKFVGAKWAHLFANYPDSYAKPVKLARMRLDRLSGTKEFMKLLSE